LCKFTAFVGHNRHKGICFFDQEWFSSEDDALVSFRSFVWWISLLLSLFESIDVVKPKNEWSCMCFQRIFSADINDSL
jgi:hypothetical protein